MAFYLILSLFLVLVGHAFRLLRWEQFIRIYERPLRARCCGAWLAAMPSTLCCPSTWAMCSARCSPAAA